MPSALDIYFTADNNFPLETLSLAPTSHYPKKLPMGVRPEEDYVVIQGKLLTCPHHQWIVRTTDRRLYLFTVIISFCREEKRRTGVGSFIQSIKSESGDSK